MTGRRRGTTAWQDEIFEWRQWLIERIEFFLETPGVLRFDQAHTWDAELAAEVEQIVLHAGETFMDICRQVGHRKYMPMVLLASSTVP